MNELETYHRSMLGGERVHSHLFQYSAHTGHVMLEFLRVSLDKRWRNPALSKLKNNFIQKIKSCQEMKC